MFLCIEKVHATDTLRIVRVNASFLNDTVEVTRKIVEIDGGNEKESEPQNGEGKKDDYSDASSMPETEPEKKPGSLRYLWWIPIIAAGAGTIWFIVFRRRSDEEEEG